MALRAEELHTLALASDQLPRASSRGWVLWGGALAVLVASARVEMTVGKGCGARGWVMRRVL
ncbi:hypothetical protein GCM10029976_091540 [Kribbella albertanoniae]